MQTRAIDEAVSLRAMGLKDVTDRSAVLDAIDEFDDLGREIFLEKYGFRPSRSYVLEYTGRRYDSKAIVGAAHGYQHGRPLASDEFSGGDATVKPLLEGLGFHVARLENARVDTDSTWLLEPGEITTRSEIKAAYGGTIYGGIEPSRTSPNILIYTDPVQGALHGYNYDGWDPVAEGVFFYTGEGRSGDQRMVDGNKAILEHFETARTLRLFEAVDGKQRPGGKLQRYVGAFRVDQADPWRYEPAPDSEGKQRKVIVFRLIAEDD